MNATNKSSGKIAGADVWAGKSGDLITLRVGRDWDNVGEEHLTVDQAKELRKRLKSAIAAIEADTPGVTTISMDRAEFLERVSE